MKISTVVGAIVAAVGFTDALAVPEIKAKRQSNFVPITGVPNNGVQTRMEIRTMAQTEPDMYNVYLLGLQEFMAVDQTNPYSYYQIAGIHGRPYSPWQGWTSPAGASGYGGGYCTHVSPIFATWHRPYLALFEQTLYQHVNWVAGNYTNSTLRTKYKAAALNFRIPYWDWAFHPGGNAPNFPTQISSPTASVVDKHGNGNKITIANPLYQYKFHPLNANDFEYNPFAQEWPVTMRAPTTNNANAVSNDGSVTNQMNNDLGGSKGLAARMWSLLYNATTTPFSHFSNEAWEAGLSNVDSLEAVHDSIHGITGSGGHMTYLDYSAFDPVFWLHHANVDRFWAMWSVINPDSYVVPSKSTGSTYTYPGGTYLDANVGLVPFAKNAQNQLWTSQDVRSTSTLGYDYPETGPGSSRNSIYFTNWALYYQGPGGPNASKKMKREISSPYDFTYQANIVSQKFALNGSYAVYVFFGEPPSDLSTWSTAENLVGLHAVTANLADETNPGMSNMNVPVTGVVMLSPALYTLYNEHELADMDPSVVEPYLKQNMQWRVATYQGQYVEVKDLPDFSITVVVDQMVRPSAADPRPEFIGSASLANVTFGQDGGHDDKWWGREKSWSLGDLISNGLSPNGKH